MKALNCLAATEVNSKEYAKLHWLLKYRKFITELNSINQAIAQIQTILKSKGLSNQTIKQTGKILDKLMIDNQRIRCFQVELKKYLNVTKAQLSNEKNILCTSDIIESSFGKYKNYLSQNSMIGITNLSLCLAAFTNNLDAEELKEGLEKTTINDLKNWTKNNIGETNLSKRRRVLQINGV